MFRQITLYLTYVYIAIFEKNVLAMDFFFIIITNIHTVYLPLF